jgi:HK97 gp10 family phage protein
MAFRIRARVTGLGPTLAVLKRIGSWSVRKQILSEAMRKAAHIVWVAARQNIRHERSGQLKKSLGSVVRAYASSGVVVAVVGPRSRVGARKQPFRIGIPTPGGGQLAINPVFYAHLVEFGRKKVRVVNAKVLAGFDVQRRLVPQAGGRRKRLPVVTGRVVFGTEVGPAAPRPFMRPAIQNNMGRVRWVITKTVWAGILRHARRKLGIP